MPAALRITLTTEEHQTLKELEVADSVPRRTKQRATALRLNATGWKVKAIANYLGWAQSQDVVHKALCAMVMVKLVNKNLFLAPSRRGRRVNIMGVWVELTRFEYALKVGTYKTNTYLRLMDWQAQRAMQRLFETGKPTVIIHDNASIHHAKLVQQRHQIWFKQGLSVFFLPPSSPEMNRIEEQWLHLKRQELGGYVFEYEYDERFSNY